MRQSKPRKGGRGDAGAAKGRRGDATRFLESVLPPLGGLLLEIAEILLALNAFDDALQNASSAHARFKELDMPYEAAKAQMVSALAAMGTGGFDQAHSDVSSPHR